MNGELTRKQAAFVREFGIDRNATQAAIRAGYSPNGAEVSACRLLRMAKVRSAVDAQEQKHAESCGVTKESLTNELEQARLLAHSNNQAAPAVSAVMGKAKIHGFMVDKTEHSGAVTVLSGVQRHGE